MRLETDLVAFGAAASATGLQPWISFGASDENEACQRGHQWALALELFSEVPDCSELQQLNQLTETQKTWRECGCYHQMANVFLGADTSH